MSAYRPFPQADVERGLTAITELQACRSSDQQADRAVGVLLDLVRRFVPYGEQIADEWEATSAEESCGRCGHDVKDHAYDEENELAHDCERCGCDDFITKTARTRAAYEPF
jgi:hypothetical protein